MGAISAPGTPDVYHAFTRKLAWSIIPLQGDVFFGDDESGDAAARRRLVDVDGGMFTARNSTLEVKGVAALAQSVGIAPAHLFAHTLVCLLVLVGAVVAAGGAVALIGSCTMSERKRESTLLEVRAAFWRLMILASGPMLVTAFFQLSLDEGDVDGDGDGDASVDVGLFVCAIACILCFAVGVPAVGFVALRRQRRHITRSPLLHAEVKAVHGCVLRALHTPPCGVFAPCLTSECLVACALAARSSRTCTTRSAASSSAGRPCAP